MVEYRNSSWSSAFYCIIPWFVVVVGDEMRWRLSGVTAFEFCMHFMVDDCRAYGR
jgi:hypothetical protein